MGDGGLCGFNTETRRRRDTEEEKVVLNDRGMRLMNSLTMYLIDKSIFESRSKLGCSNSDYRLCRTLCCNRCGVEDDELLDFYFDPSDLSRQVSVYYEEPACPFCGAKPWDYVEITDPAEVPAEWHWAVKAVE
jgi:hypothetical protein